MSLITTISELKTYVPFEGNTRMETLQPFINEAEDLYVKPLLGKEFYTELQSEYDASQKEDPTPLSADTAALLPYVQRAIAYYTQLLAIPQLSAPFGELGVRQHRGEDSDVAPRWMIEKLQLSALKSGDIHADRLLAFLEENASIEKYATWYQSEANTVNSGTIVYNTAIASKHIDIGESRRIYLQLRPTIVALERRFVPRLIGQSQYADLINNIQANTVSAEYAKLIDRLEPIICKRALFMRLPFMQVSIGHDGAIWLYSDVSELRKKDFLASREDVKILRHELMDGELGYLAYEEELRQFIIDNIADYPLMKSSPVYTVQPDPGPTWDPRNSHENKFFSV